jgi:hypothetical protein
MTTLTQASHQWATRPADERFVNLIDLAAHVKGQRERSKSGVISNRKLSLAPVEGDDRGLMLVGPNGHAVAPSHYSFGQLCTVANGTPAGYMRKLHPTIAADCINWGLRQRDVEEVGILLRKEKDGPATLAAATGPNYGRIWNDQIAQQLVKRLGNGIDGDFTVPGEFGRAVEVTKENTTLFAGDRDMFVFLADEKNKVEISNRRNGQAGEMSRGFFVWNSEVGSSTFGIASFLFDYVCSNRMVWGATEFKEIRLRHTSGAPDRFIEQVQPAIKRLANASMLNVVQAVEDAKAKRIGDQDEVHEFLAKRFTKSEVKAINLAHMVEEQKPIETIWDAVTGVTAYAKTISWQDERVDVERKAGQIMKLAA